LKNRSNYKACIMGRLSKDGGGESMNSRKKGDDAEQFVADYLRKLGFVVEIHPRTFRFIRTKAGRMIQISQDNDYHNVFDVKAEGTESMIYAQVKLMPDGTVSNGNISQARKKIDSNYPFTFFYIRVQVWQVWQEWVAKPHRHKEYKCRVWERHGYEEIMVSGVPKAQSQWDEIS